LPVRRIQAKAGGNLRINGPVSPTTALILASLSLSSVSYRGFESNRTPALLEVGDDNEIR